MWFPVVALLLRQAADAVIQVESESPYCDLLLNIQNIDTKLGWNPSNCNVQTYKITDVVDCFDEMLQNQERWMHFAFIGDSRIRYQFYSFLELVPQHDLIWRGSPERHRLQEDMYVVSPMLNVIVSFRWRKMLNETILSEFVDWSASPIKAKPDLIMMGMSAHHMLPENGGDHRIFENILQKVKWQIQKISNQTKVIWMNQQPVVETQKVNKSSLVHSDKLEQYNRAARRILKDSGAIIWDSGNHLAEEYLRACMLQSRSDLLWQQNCNDHIHTGFVALTRGTQLFLNFLCNKFIGPTRFARTSNICCAQ